MCSRDKKKKKNEYIYCGQCRFLQSGPRYKQHYQEPMQVGPFRMNGRYSFSNIQTDGNRDNEIQGLIVLIISFTKGTIQRWKKRRMI